MKFVAVTSCPTGIAHSQMAAEGLEQAAESMGHDIRVEIQGAMGAEDELTSEEITEADAVVIAADTSVNRDRFQGKPLVKAKVAEAINEAESLLEEAIEEAGGEGSTTEAESETSTEPETTSEPEPTAETGTATATEESTDTTRQTESTGIIGKIKRLFS